MQVLGGAQRKMHLIFFSNGGMGNIGEDLRENVTFKLGLEVGIGASWTKKEG